MSVNRRDFLAASAAAGATLSAPAVHGAERNKKYRTALVGSGWWGMNITRTAIEAGESDVVALCDVDRNQLDPAAAEVEKLTGKAPKKYRDYRELLGDFDTVPVSIPHDCTDGFMCAYWRRPRAYLDPTVRNNISTFALFDNQEQGLRSLREDLDSGRWLERYGTLMDMDNCDFGYRLLLTGRR